MTRCTRRSVIVGTTLVVAAGLVAGSYGTGSGAAKAATATGDCTSGQAAAPSSQADPRPTAGWPLPDANQQSTRDAASPINSSNVARLGVAWCVPVARIGGYGNYSATPVVVDGVVYTEDLQSDVMAIQLSTGKMLWQDSYNLPAGGPDGVNVVDGTVYAEVGLTGVVALRASTGAQLWSRTLVQNDHEGIDMAPGYDHGTVYVSTVPVNSTSQYGAGGKGILFALDAKTGVPEWQWDEVQDLWGNPAVNSGGGQWYTPSFDRQGNIYIGVGNPGPLGGAPGFPWGTSRPGPDLYTDSVVKLSPHGKLLWYYQLTPHDLYDWDLQDPPMLTTAGGRPVVIDGGKAGILIELDQRTGKPIWKTPVGAHNGHDDDGLLTEWATPGSPLAVPEQVTVAPGPYGGIETQLATDARSTFAAINEMPGPYLDTQGPDFGSPAALSAALLSATGEVVAVDNKTGKIEWDTPLPSTPYGAVTVTNDVVFTTTFNGQLYALNAKTGAVLLKTALSAFSNAPVAIAGDYLLTGSALPASTQQPLIIAYKLGATGTLPSTAGS